MRLLKASLLVLLDNFSLLNHISKLKLCNKHSTLNNTNNLRLYKLFSLFNKLKLCNKHSKFNNTNNLRLYHLFSLLNNIKLLNKPNN